MRVRRVLLISTLTTRCLCFSNPNLVLCEILFLRKDQVNVDFTVLEVGDYVQFYEPHRTFGDNDGLHTAEILSIVDDVNPLVLSSRFVLSRHHRVRKVVPGVSVDDDSDGPLVLRPHWRFIENYTLTYEGTHDHATAVLRAAENAKKNAHLIK